MPELRITPHAIKRFRQGDTSKWDYPPKALNWTDRGEPFDILEWKKEI